VDHAPGESIERAPFDPARGGARPGARLAGLALADRFQLLALVVVAVGLTVGAVRALQAGWVPVGDEALIEMRVRDVPGHLPLLGVYSRFGWSHPGPAQLLALAVPYRLLGSSSAALLVGALAGHLVTVAATWWIARRIDRLLGAVVLVAWGLVLLGVPADLVRSAWNPYVALLLAGALVVVAWGTVEGIALAAVLWLPVGTFLVQAHVGNAPLVGLISVVTLVLLGGRWWVSRRARDDGVDDEGVDGAGAVSRQDPTPWRPLALGAALAALMWLPAVVDQLTAERGNLGRIVGDLSRDEPRVGVGDALGFVSRSFSWRPDWTDQGSLLLQIAETAFTWPVWLLLPLGAALVGWRRRDLVMLRGLALAAVGVASSVLAAAAVKGIFFSYLMVANRSLVAVLVAVSLTTIVRASGAAVRRVAVLATSAVAVLVMAGVGIAQWSADNPSQPFDPTVRAVAAAVQDERTDGEAVFVTATADDPSRDVASGLLLQLERDGVPATTVRDEDWRMGAHRTGDGAAALQVKVAPTGQEQLLLDEGYTIAFEYQPLSAAEVAEVERLVGEREDLIAEGQAAGPDDPGAAARFAQVQSLAERIDEVRDGRLPALVGVRR
jgi:hypothetical protein